jgi:hypothetical protein
MISTAATVFAQGPVLPRISRRLQRAYVSIQLPDGRFVLNMPSVGTVVMAAFEDALRLHYVAQDAAQDFAARTALEALLHRALRGVVFTIAWEETDSVSIPRA